MKTSPAGPAIPRLPSSSVSEDVVVSRSARIEEAVLLHVGARDFSGIMSLADSMGKARSTVSRSVSSLRLRNLVSLEGRAPRLTPAGLVEVRRILTELPVRKAQLEELKDKADDRLEEVESFERLGEIIKLGGVQ